MPVQKKKIDCFISSSIEDLNIADEIRNLLGKEGINSKIWNKQTFSFGLSVADLQNIIAISDLAIFIIPSELSIEAGKKENIFFEIGVIVGTGIPLLIIVPTDARLELPSDLSSMLYLRYDPRNKQSSFRHIRNWAVHSLNDSM